MGTATAEDGSGREGGMTPDSWAHADSDSATEVVSRTRLAIRSVIAPHHERRRHPAVETDGVKVVRICV